MAPVAHNPMDVSHRGRSIHQAKVCITIIYGSMDLWMAIKRTLEEKGVVVCLSALETLAFPSS